LLADLPTDGAQPGAQPEDVVELRRLLYGLYGVLRLHNAQEEEGAFSLVPGGSAGSPTSEQAGRASRPAGWKVS
jgi:hypothetical protein